MRSKRGGRSRPHRPPAPLPWRIFEACPIQVARKASVITIAGFAAGRPSSPSRPSGSEDTPCRERGGCLPVESGRYGAASGRFVHTPPLPSSATATAGAATTAAGPPSTQSRTAAINRRRRAPACAPGTGVRAPPPPPWGSGRAVFGVGVGPGPVEHVFAVGMAFQVQRTGGSSSARCQPVTNAASTGVRGRAARWRAGRPGKVVKWHEERAVMLAVRAGRSSRGIHRQRVQPTARAPRHNRLNCFRPVCHLPDSCLSNLCVAQLNLVVGDMPGNARTDHRGGPCTAFSGTPAADAGAGHLRLHRRRPVPAPRFHRRLVMMP